MSQGNPRPGEVYLHFKQKLYQIVTVAEHSETGEKLVVYQALYGTFKTYARPLQMFISPVDTEKYPDVKQKYRFQLQEQSMLEETDSKSGQMTQEAVSPGSGQAAQEKKSMTPQEKQMAFFDADTAEEKYKILLTMSDCITHDMINNMAVVMDLVVEDGPLEDRYEELKHCLCTIQQYESTRLR